jgi:2-haloacid dehalogenase
MMVVRALVFDVFGTVVDWRSSIIREGELLGAAKGLQVDWPAFADAWRAGYRPAMDRVAGGEHGWANIDALHREILDSLITRFGIVGLTDEETDRFNRAWHRLMPWPDSVPGLNRLRSRYVISTLSNGNISLLVDMAKHAGLPWDCVLSGELIGKYKPDPEVYRMAARLLGVKTDEAMLVAAHPQDLQGAQRAGLKSAYVPRPLEHGPDRPPAPPTKHPFDIVAADFIDLATRLGC